MNKLHLACAADSDYAAHSAAMLHSAISHGGAPLVVHYLHGPRFPAATASKLEQMLSASPSEIMFHEIPDARLEGLPVDHRFGAAMWYRIFLPELLPDVPRILYMDVDTLVVDRLDPLWQVDLGQCYLAGVTNVFMEYHRHRAPELGIELSGYFNSGVLMLNLAVMRGAGFAGALVEMVKTRGPDLLWPDQDALNLVAGSQWVRLHPRWNVMNSFTTRPGLAADVFGQAALAEACAHPAIRHFEGPGINKPWHVCHEQREQELYRQHRQATPWPQVRLEGDRPVDAVRRVVLEGRRRGRSLRHRLGGTP